MKYIYNMNILHEVIQMTGIYNFLFLDLIFLLHLETLNYETRCPLGDSFFYLYWLDWYYTGSWWYGGPVWLHSWGCLRPSVSRDGVERSKHMAACWPHLYRRHRLPALCQPILDNESTGKYWRIKLSYF